MTRGEFANGTIFLIFQIFFVEMEVERLNPSGHSGIKTYYKSKIEELEIVLSEKEQDLRRLEAQRNELNSKVRKLKDELAYLQEPSSYVGEVVKAMGKNKILVKV